MQAGGTWATARRIGVDRGAEADNLGNPVKIVITNNIIRGLCGYSGVFRAMVVRAGVECSLVLRASFLVGQ